MHKTVPNKISSVIHTKLRSNHTYDPTHNAFPQSYITCKKIGFSTSKYTAVEFMWCTAFLSMVYDYKYKFLLEAWALIGKSILLWLYSSIYINLYVYEYMEHIFWYFLCFGSDIWNMYKKWTNCTSRFQDAQLHYKMPHRETKFVIIVN